ESNCVECKDDAGCGSNQGRYCTDGLCQSCIIDSHCGADCKACPSSTPVCGGGSCVQCSKSNTRVCDAEGQICDTNTCVPCIDDRQCGSNKICDRAFGQC